MSVSPSVSAFLRCKYSSQFHTNDPRQSTLKCWGVVMMHPMLALLSCILANLLFQSGNWIGWFCVATSTVFVGSRMRAWANILHECSHGSFARSRKLNHFFGNVISVLLFIGLKKYKREHLSHHKYLGDPEKDLDLNGHFFQPIIIGKEEKKITNIGRVLLLSLLILLSFFSTTRHISIIFFWVPYFTSFQLFRYLSDKADHGGMSANKDEFMRSRNHTTQLTVINWFIFPHHDTYHLIHHLFPGISAKYHGKCHDILMQEEIYSKRMHGVEFCRLGPK